MTSTRMLLRRWMREPSFVHTLHEAEAASIDEGARMLVRISRTAVATIAKAMTGTTTPMATRVRAADIALSRLQRVLAWTTLERGSPRSRRLRS